MKELDMGVRARSMRTRRSLRRRGAAVPLALLAVVALGSSALGAYWTPTATLASSPAADSIRTAAISASGPNIVAGWRDTVAGTQELWVRESNDSGGAWAATVRLVVAADEGIAAPRVSLELRDEGGLVLGSAAQDTRALGWDGAAGERELCFSLDRLPLADGRFHLRIALVDAANGKLLHSLEDALRFFVFPAGDESGAVLLDGRWSMQEIEPRAPIPRP